MESIKTLYKGNWDFPENDRWPTTKSLNPKLVLSYSLYVDLCWHQLKGYSCWCCVRGPTSAIFYPDTLANTGSHQTWGNYTCCHDYFEAHNVPGFRETDIGEGEIQLVVLLVFKQGMGPSQAWPWNTPIAFECSYLVSEKLDRSLSIEAKTLSQWKQLPLAPMAISWNQPSTLWPVPRCRFDDVIPN